MSVRRKCDISFDSSWFSMEFIAILISEIIAKQDLDEQYRIRN